MNLIALNDRVIVKKGDIVDHLHGLVMADTVKDALTVYEGTILSIGPTATKGDNGSLIQVGDTIRFNKYSGLNVDNSDDSILAIAVTDLLCIDPERRSAEASELANAASK
jgi:co-chaperonin GroES (HSP10)